MHSNISGVRLSVSLALVTILGPSAIDMYLASMPPMAADLGTTFSRVQLTLTVFLLALGLGQLFFGPVIDAYGRRRPLLIGIVAFVCAGVVAATAGSIETLLYARFFQGLAASLTLVVAISTVRDVAEGAAAAKLFALLMTIEGLAPVLAPAAGGFIDTAYGWRGVMWALAGLGMLALANTYFSLPETLAPEKRSSIKPGEVVVTYGRIMSDVKFLIPALALSSAFFFLFAYIGGVGLVYQEYFGLSPALFGTVFGATGIAVLLGAIGSSRLVGQYGVSRLAVWGGLLILVGAAIATVSVYAGIGLWGVVAGMFVAMLGIGISEATLMAIAMNSQQRAHGSTAALLGGMMMTIGAAATPISATTSAAGAGQWALSLLVMAAVVCVLSVISAKTNAHDSTELAAAH